MNLKYFKFTLLFFLVSILGCKDKPSDLSILVSPKLKALIIDGENNHGIWPKTTMMLKSYLEEVGFEVSVKRKKYCWQGPHHGEVPEVSHINELLDLYPIENHQCKSVDSVKLDSSFILDLQDIDLVVSNFGWQATSLPVQSQIALEEYINKGGGLAIVHAANNAWPEWEAFNTMIGLGGWGERTEKDGPYIYYNKENELIRDVHPGQGGSHGPEMDFLIDTRNPEHPIMAGLPNTWLHYKDELYDRLRGPAQNLTVLATAFSDKIENMPPWDKNTPGTDRHEPILMTIEFGQGRIFHTTLGHMDYSMECVGFITTFQRGAEWAATGEVNQEVPKDFPTAQSTSRRKWKRQP